MQRRNAPRTGRHPSPSVDEDWRPGAIEPHRPERNCGPQNYGTLAPVDGRLQHPEIDSSTFRDVVGRFASGVTVITTNDEGQDFGMTASAMSSLTDLAGTDGCTTSTNGLIVASATGTKSASV